MLDFLRIAEREGKNKVVEIFPDYYIKKSSDLMIRGGDFYAIWVEERHLWSTDEEDAIQLIDQELDRYYERKKDEYRDKNKLVKVLHLKDAGTKMIDAFHHYCRDQCRDKYEPLDEKVIFSNTETKKTDYASKHLDYPFEQGDYSAFDKLISTLYDPEERKKIEWAIGSIITGASKDIQKFIVLYGGPGTGKSTILNIIEKLFDGYYSVFDAKALGTSNASFALEAFRNNPLVAIQHDGDLSKIEDNTRLNSLVAHEYMMMNEKYKSAYPVKLNSFLFMGTNRPVKITDIRSGITRRLIDVRPTGNIIPFKEYLRLMGRIEFELGAIAFHCAEVYTADPNAYDGYTPKEMIGASNDVYNFVQDLYFEFEGKEYVTLARIWELYQQYCDDARVPYPYSKRVLKEEIKYYFKDFKDDCRIQLEGEATASHLRNVYFGFKTDLFGESKITEVEDNDFVVPNIVFEKQDSVFDEMCKIYPAQYANRAGKPSQAWDDVTTLLRDIDTHKTHYVRVPENHIVIDFDLVGPDGKKSFEKNLEAASKWPPTYAELSKSGAGIHLHYIYPDDPTKLSHVYDSNIEIKVFTGKSSLRRKLTKCNNLPISTIKSGLPLKGEKPMVSKDVIKTEAGLQNMIERCLHKEFGSTTQNIHFIDHLLNEAYESGMPYDLRKMRNAVLIMATNSTNQAQHCIAVVKDMKFKSAEDAPSILDDSEKPIVIFDVEVVPNLFLICWKYLGEEASVVRMFNPEPDEVKALFDQYRMIGFNNRQYDNHICYARMNGYSTSQLHALSGKIINAKNKVEKKNAMFGPAYGISYTDVYDVSTKKQGLKAWEIELDFNHDEFEMGFDDDLPEEKWETLADYCENDVRATEKVWMHIQPDFIAREILADLSGITGAKPGTVNDTTNQLTAKLIFGADKNPQKQFIYTDLGKYDEDMDGTGGTFCYEEAVKQVGCNLQRCKERKDNEGITCPESPHIFEGDKPYFPGYEFKDGHSLYRGEDPKEGGYVYSKPGMYWNVALLDVASMHPSSIIALELFGPKYTKIFAELVQARLYIKHKDFKAAGKLFGGKLKPYLKDENMANGLAGALKIAINSVYGLTSAKFANPFRDERNIDNIVAKRGALFMIDLKHAVEEQGFTVAHIKTDSIKIPDATPMIIEFVKAFGKLYGYTFEHEATYNRMCLVNDAVYIAQYQDTGEWTATGTQFQVPYVFKTLFSHDPIIFKDVCEKKSVTGQSALYLDLNEKMPDVSEYEKKRKKMVKDGEDTTKIDKEIAKGHSYNFVGRVGEFCPVKPGAGGGLLMREKDGKYYAATGTKGYRWMESSDVKNMGKQDDVDISYYRKLVDAAVDEINEYGDFDTFVNGPSQPLPF